MTAVHEVMSTSPVTVRPTASVGDAEPGRHLEGAQVSAGSWEPSSGTGIGAARQPGSSDGHVLSVAPNWVGGSMKPDKTGPRLGGGNTEASQIHREAVEMLIDEIGAQSFPASDPAAWGVVGSRLEEESRASRARKRARGSR